MSLIETSYVPLHKAAEMLKSDVETLLIAACENRILLHALANALIKNEDADDREFDNMFVKSHTTDGGHDVYVSLFINFTVFHGAGELLKRGKARVYFLLKELGEGRTLAGKVDNEDGYIDVTRDQVFMLRSDIEKFILLNALPEAGSVHPPELPQHQSANTKRTDTLKVVIAALCKEAGIDPKTPGAASKIARMTDSLRASVSESTIKALLDALPDAVAKRMK